jgi:signal peptidase I
MSRLTALLVGAHPKRTLLRIALLIASAILIFGWVLVPTRTQGISMQPTYESGTLHFVNRFSYVGAGPRRGDIVAISLGGERVYYVKRIVGLPGERVRIVKGVVHIDDAPLVEPYVVKRRAWDVEEVELRSHEYFVIGDNRGMNARDHDFGRVLRSRIAGRIVF